MVEVFCCDDVGFVVLHLREDGVSVHVIVASPFEGEILVLIFQPDLVYVVLANQLLAFDLERWQRNDTHGECGVFRTTELVCSDNRILRGVER